MVEELKIRASMIWGIDASDVEFNDSVFNSGTDPELKLDWKDLAARLDETGGPVQSTAR